MRRPAKMTAGKRVPQRVETRTFLELILFQLILGLTEMDNGIAVLLFLDFLAVLGLGKQISYIVPTMDRTSSALYIEIYNIEEDNLLEGF